MTTLRTPLHRVTQSALSGFYGPDRGRKIVVTLTPGNGSDVPDLITLRPQGRRSVKGETVPLEAVYLFALRSRTNKEQREKAKEKKAKHADRLARQRLARSIRTKTL